MGYFEDQIIVWLCIIACASFVGFVWNIWYVCLNHVFGQWKTKLFL